jgi:hypothetical protein
VNGIQHLVVYPACRGRSQLQSRTTGYTQRVITRLHANQRLKCFLWFTRALQHRGIRDPGLSIKGVLFPLVVFGLFVGRTLY